MRTLPVGVVPTKTELRRVAQRGARDLGAGRFAHEGLHLREARPERREHGVAGCAPLRLARERERRVELVGLDQSFDRRNRRGAHPRGPALAQIESRRDADRGECHDTRGDETTARPRRCRRRGERAQLAQQRLGRRRAVGRVAREAASDESHERRRRVAAIADASDGASFAIFSIMICCHEPAKGGEPLSISNSSAPTA